MTSGKIRLSPVLVIWPLAALLTAPPAGADWLVTRQGDRVETRGSWQEKGKLVVFHRPDGSLSSLRLSEVDLEASRAATHRAQEEKDRPAKAEAPRPKKPSVVSLTDEDFQSTASSPAPAAEPEKGAKDEKAPDKKASSLSVASWDRGKAPDGHVVITGTLRNATADQAAASGVTVLLFDETGAPIGQLEGVLTSTVIPGGGTVGFQADFPGVFSFAAAKFETRSLNLGTKPGAPAAIPSSQR
jgi:hypothetical protein